MKLIYLANIRLPTEKAHGIQVMKMCQAFVRRGIKLKLVVARRINEQFKGRDPFDYYEIKEKFPIKKLPLLDLVDIKWLPRKICVFLQNFSFALNSFFYLIFKKYDLVYSRDEFSLFFLSLTKKNLIYEMHTFPNFLLPQNQSGVGHKSMFVLGSINRNLWATRIGALFYKRIWKKIKGIVVITYQLKELLTRQGILEDKILVAPDGVDLEKFDIKISQIEARRRLKLPLDKRIILYSGHLFHWKGVYTLVQISNFKSIHFVQDKFQISNLLIIIVGGMPYDIQQLKKYIVDHDLPKDKILLLGHKEPKLIPLYLKAADILVLPNSVSEPISQKFTSPLKMFEYMASKRPIVASSIDSIREILNERNAILVEPDSPESLAQGIDKVLNDKNLAYKISSQAFQDVQKYTWQKRAEKILNFTGVSPPLTFHKTL